jgi:hypothetical protein
MALASTNNTPVSSGKELVLLCMDYSRYYESEDAHKEKCLAFSLDLPRESKSLRASPSGLARSRKAGSR